MKSFNPLSILHFFLLTTPLVSSFTSLSTNRGWYNHRSTSSSSSLLQSSTTTESNPASNEPYELVPGRPTWQQTMLRISNPEKTIPFYTDVMGMTLIDTLDFPQYEFKLFFLTTLPEGESYDLIPGTQEAHVCLIC